MTGLIMMRSILFANIICMKDICIRKNPPYGSTNANMK